MTQNSCRYSCGGYIFLVYWVKDAYANFYVQGRETIVVVVMMMLMGFLVWVWYAYRADYMGIYKQVISAKHPVSN